MRKKEQITQLQVTYSGREGKFNDIISLSITYYTYTVDVEEIYKPHISGNIINL